AHVDRAVGDGGGGFADRIRRAVFPAQFAGGEIDGEQIFGLRPHVHGAAGDGGGRLDGLAGVVGPEQLQRRRDRPGGDSGELRVAAKLRPVVGRGRGGEERGGD